ncbi:pleckstrin homology domain-containing family S member 1-like isoform X2 [Onychostoma macrolepis]|uniref:pleckstrin homology domain-containing family S member 1-like isoform X2 n=1 Tax=Onychostoma macrolepis TaxID=369639 RepID=UPI00272A84FF|nr:pleckstrin homology domain-containing family S member 1-like isoform X2 [Onychostoma macrolepis]
MSNNKKSPTAKFYREPEVKELYTGYLVKSPPLTALTKNTKSWKKRFFVLSKKTDEDSYQLTYHVNERRDKPLGVIDISKISLLFTSPETHQKWDWVKKPSKGSPSSVLFLKVEDDILKPSREYFLIGENSADVDGWLNALFKAMKTQKSQNKQRQKDDTPEKRSRSMSLLVNYSEPKVEDEPNDRRSAPELMPTYPPPDSHYVYPRKLSEPPIPVTCKFPVIEEKDETDEKQDGPPEDSSEYMSMGSVKMVLEDDQQEDDTACKQKNDDHNHSKQSISFSGNCASTELDNSETYTHVEKETCDSQNDLKDSLTLTQEGKPSVSECRQIQDSSGDQTLPPGTVQEIQKYIKRLSKDEVKLLIQRLPALTLNPAHHTEDTKQSLMRNLSPPSK